MIYPLSFMMITLGAVSIVTATQSEQHLAPASPSTLMEILRDSWTFAHTSQGTSHPRVTFASFLERTDTHLRAIWDQASTEAQEFARFDAMRPLGDTPNPLPGPYWRWVPELIGDTVSGNGGSISFNSPCFNSINAVGALSSNGDTFILNLTASAPVNNTCVDSYLLGTPEWLNLMTFDTSKGASTQRQSVSFPASSTRPGARQWLNRHGVRILRFLDANPLTIIYEAIETISLFIPSLISSPPDAASADRNYDFLFRDSNISMPIRAIPDVTVDPSLIGGRTF